MQGRSDGWLIPRLGRQVWGIWDYFHPPHIFLIGVPRVLKLSDAKSSAFIEIWQLRARQPGLHDSRFMPCLLPDH